MSSLTLNETAEKQATERAGKGWKKPAKETEGSPTEPKLMTVKASEVEPKELDWLWLHRFLRGHINIIAGDPGLGKSMLLIAMAARASRGGDWPDGSPCKQCSVLYSTTEDGIADTVVPRLIAADADLERVHIVEGVKGRNDSELPLFLNEHLIYLDEMLTENPEIGILIIDTLQSHIGSAVATNNNSSVRGVMTPLKRLAEKHHVAVLCIEHLTKSKTMSGENATYRVQGSIAFAGAARSVWIVAKDQEDESGKRRYLQASKTNLAPDNSGLGLAYEIHGATKADSRDQSIGQTIEGPPERSCAIISNVEVIRAVDHFQNAWKSKIHFQRVASGCADDVASGVWCPWAPKPHRQKLLIQPFERVWPHQQPCVFVLSLNYFRTRKPHKTLETLKNRLPHDVRCDRSVERLDANSRRSVSPKRVALSNPES